MVVLIDVDNVMNNFSETLLAWHNRAAVNKKDIHTIEEIDNYDWFSDTYGDDAWKPTEYKEFWDDVEINPDMAKMAFNIPHILNQYGFTKVYFVTASHYNEALPYKIKTTLDKINKYKPKDEFFKFDENHIIVSSHKNRIAGDILIDDCFDNCESFMGHNNSRVAVLWAKPWNKRWSYNYDETECLTKPIISTSSTEQVEGIIRGVNAMQLVNRATYGG